jgi:hypothetical protein
MRGAKVVEAKLLTLDKGFEEVVGVSLGIAVVWGER